MTAKIAGLIITFIFIIMIFSILRQPQITAIDVELKPGVLTLENTTVYEGSFVNFTGIGFSVKYDEYDSIDYLNFTIYKNDTGEYVNHVIFTKNGTIQTSETNGVFSILDTTASGGETIIHPAHGYTPETVTYTDYNYSYDVSYKAKKIGTFYAKLNLHSDDGIYNSDRTETFTVAVPDEFLFDVELDVSEPEVYVGDNNTAIIDLTNVGEEGLVNATVERIIYYGDIIIWSNITNVSVSGKKSMISSIPTDGFEPGTYRYEVIHRYGDGRYATASQIFVVKEKVAPPIQESENPYMLIITPIVGIIVLVLILSLLVNKGLLLIAAGKQIQYVLMYDQKDPVKELKIRELLFGQETVSEYGNQSQVSAGLLDNMNYTIPEESILILFDQKKDLQKIVSALNKYEADFQAGTFVRKEEQVTDEATAEPKDASFESEGLTLESDEPAVESGEAAVEPEQKTP